MIVGASGRVPITNFLAPLFLVFGSVAWTTYICIVQMSATARPNARSIYTSNWDGCLAQWEETRAVFTYETTLPFHIQVEICSEIVPRTYSKLHIHSTEYIRCD